jgi:predicted nucleic acid-binding protein
MVDALLDTTVFIDYYSGHPGARQLVSSITAGQLAAAYSPLTVFELWLRPMGRTEELAHVSLLALLEELPVTSRVPQRAAQWLAGRGRGIRHRLIGDALIAATAAEQGEVLYTRNVRDFTRFNANVRSY